jgi:RNA polymerase sigma factor (sigma-70 family)
MPDETPFQNLIRRVRLRDQQACAELVHTYLPDVLRIVRMQISNLNLQQVIEADDICQIVLANFFIRMADGQFQLNEPAQLKVLLGRMARNQVLDEGRRAQASRRARQRTLQANEAMQQVPSADATPSRIIASSELLAEIYRRMSNEERQVADQRALGTDWQAIAEAMGSSSEAVRKKLSRAYDRVLKELNLSGIIRV